MQSIITRFWEFSKRNKKKKCWTSISVKNKASSGKLGVGNGNPLQYSCLENSMDRGAWRATVHRVAKSQTQLSMHALMHTQKKIRWFFFPFFQTLYPLLPSCEMGCYLWESQNEEKTVKWGNVSFFFFLSYVNLIYNNTLHSHHIRHLYRT